MSNESAGYDVRNSEVCGNEDVVSTASAGSF